MKNQSHSMNIGAHEMMECHEVLNYTVNIINQFLLYQPYCQDQELKNILQNQLSFMTNEYNVIVKALQQKTNSGQIPNVKPNVNGTPIYGVSLNSVPEAPNASINQMSDRDISAGMLGSHKSGAVFKMHAALEFTDPEMREMMTQSAKNCADQAYETWSYMNSKGYYQVPTFDQTTTLSLMNSYQQSSF